MTGHAVWEGLWKDFGNLGRKAIEGSKLGELSCGSLEDKNVESHADDRGLALEASESVTLSELFVILSCDLWFWF